MGKTQLTEAQSLELITSMINDSRSRLARNSGTPFLIWGYTTIAVSLFNALALYLGLSHMWAWSWFAIPVVGWLGMLLLNKNEPSARNYIDRIVSTIWVVIGLSFAWLFVGAVVFGCSISFLTVVVMGIGTVLTGYVIKHRTTAICGWAAMCASLIFPVAYYAITKGSAASIAESWLWGEKVVFAAIFLFMMVIPGHILNHKYNK